MPSYKQLHTQSIKDVLYHSQIASNPSLLQKGCQSLLDEVDRLYEFMKIISENPCNCKDFGVKLCGSCIATQVLSGNDEGSKQSSLGQEE